MVVNRLIRERNLLRQFKLNECPGFAFNLHIAGYFPGREDFSHFIRIDSFELHLLGFQIKDVIH